MLLALEFIWLKPEGEYLMLLQLKLEASEWGGDNI